MGEKYYYYLHELLKEDQEPFILNKYISERRTQIISKRREPSYLFPINLCKNACCLFSFPETPSHLTKSPKTPFCNQLNSHTPSSSLKQAALRIHKHSSSSTPQNINKPITKAFALFGSLFNKLTQPKKQNKKDSDINEEEDDDTMGTSCSAQCCYYDHSQQDIISIHHHSAAFCQSPFRFVLQSTPCSGSHTPDLPSPTHHITEDKESNGAESVSQLRTGEEEDKEQCSPVCVLDPTFEDDDEGHGNDHDDTDGFDLDSSYAIVQRARQQILYKLRRFEKLAELDPVELQKRMQEEEDADETFMEEDDYKMEASPCTEQVFEAVFLSSVHDEKQQIPQEFKKLISDLIVEEEKELNNYSVDRDMVMSRICKRLELWKEVECITIDMMIEEDFSREDVGWKKNVDHISKIAEEVELTIFGILVEEFSEELVC